MNVNAICWIVRLFQRAHPTCLGLQRELVDVPDCCEVWYPMTVASNSRYQKLAIHKAVFFGLKLAILFWKLGTFLGRKGGPFGWLACDLVGKFRLTIDMDMYITSTSILPPAVAGDFLNVRHSFQRYPKLFSNSFQLVKSDGWANTTGLIHTDLFVWRSVARTCNTKNSSWWLSEPWTNLQDLEDLSKKHFFYLRHTLNILMEIHISLHMY